MAKDYSQIPQISEYLNKVYDKGYDQGVRDSEQYNKAMQEAWGCVRRILHKEIKIGDKVRTTQDRDYNGNVLFPIGTIGVIKKIDKGTGLSYQVATKDSMWEWWYSEDMLEVIRDDEITIGDEVICYGANSKSIVIYIEHGEDGYIYYKCLNKLLGICTESDRYKPVKTGKHFERIDEIYERLVGE